MKSIAIFLSVFLMSFFSVDISENNLKSDNLIEEIAVFDGKEGNLYFFTNTKKEALTIQDDDDVLKETFTEKPNDFVDTSFKIVIKKKHLVKNFCDAKNIIKINIKEK